MIELPFTNRQLAGRLLADKVAEHGFQDPVVYALPRGGAPVAIEIAEKLGAPLDLLLVRKIGAPGQEELAAGSIVDGERPDVIVNNAIVKALGISDSQFQAAAARALEDIERRRALYLEGAPPVTAKGAAAILVDDGIATGASMRAAIAAVRRREPRQVVVAVPIAPRQASVEFANLADAFICLATPSDFKAVGSYYRDFQQLSDSDVIALMRRARTAHPAIPG